MKQERKPLTTDQVAQRNIDNEGWQELHDVFGIEFMRTLINEHFAMDADEETMRSIENLKQVVLAKLEK